jgi:hypothetical protein
MQWKPTKENLQAIDASVVAYCGRMKTVSKDALQNLTLAKFERDASTAQPMHRKPYNNIVQAGTLTIHEPIQNEENDLLTVEMNM